MKIILFTIVACVTANQASQLVKEGERTSGKAKAYQEEGKSNNRLESFSSGFEVDDSKGTRKGSVSHQKLSGTHSHRDTSRDNSVQDEESRIEFAESGPVFTSIVNRKSKVSGHASTKQFLPQNENAVESQSPIESISRTVEETSPQKEAKVI